MSAAAGAAVKIHFNASRVFVVMGNSSGMPIKVQVTLDGKPLNEVVVNRHDLYAVAELTAARESMLQLTTSAPGLEVYTFTFG